MLSALQDWTASQWFVMACVLLVMEVLGCGGFLLCLGLSAASVALVVFVITTPWDVQWLLFGILSVVSAFGWHVRTRTRPKTQLNHRMSHYVGQKAVLLEPVVHGKGAVNLDDTRWPVHCPVDLPEGACVKVVGHENIVLRVEPWVES